MQAFIPCIISFFLCKNVWKIALDSVPKAVVWFPFGFFSQDVECESTALSARCICESRGWSLTGNKSSERNVTADSHRQSKVPCKCICHIHEMAWGVAAENRHKALRVTEALPKLPSPCLSLPDPLFVTCRHGSPLAWPVGVTRVQPRAAGTATEGVT